MEIIDVIRKLVGPVIPIGESYQDEKRFENLKVMTKLIDQLVFDVDQVASFKNSPAYSEKKAGEFANKFFDDLGIKD